MPGGNRSSFRSITGGWEVGSGKLDRWIVSVATRETKRCGGLTGVVEVVYMDCSDLRNSWIKSTEFLRRGRSVNTRGSSLFKTDQRFSEVTVCERGALVDMLDVVFPKRANLSDTTALAERMR